MTKELKTVRLKFGPAIAGQRAVDAFELIKSQKPALGYCVMVGVRTLSVEPQITAFLVDCGFEFEIVDPIA